MSEAMQFTIGAQAICSDGQCGEIRRLVLDPVGRAVSHLVVEPKHRQGLGRLVPLDLVDISTGEVHLRCTTAEFAKLDHAEEMEFLPGSGGRAVYAAGVPLPQPFCGLRDVIGNVPAPVTNDTIPLDEVEVGRDERVYATDGAIGRFEGLVVNSRNHHVTHILLQEGHLWGRKEVAVPINAVTAVDNGIRLNIAKQVAQKLPTLNVDRPTA